MKLYYSDSDANFYFMEGAILRATPAPELEGIIDTNGIEVCEVDPIEPKHREIILKLTQ